MIINGGSRRAGGWWARHLENAEQNERVTLAEIVGLDATTIPELMHEMEILARNSGSRAQNYFYQANVNPRDHEHLTPAQRHEAKERLLKNLGLAGQPHFVVEHEKEGRAHFHVIAFRIDMERGRAISDSLTAQIHERTSRELEIRFDLERGKSVLVPDRDFKRPERDAKKYEIFRGAQGGIDPATVSADARLAWEHADSGVAFKAALEASGDYVLARGDRRDFLIIDRACGEHSLGRRLGEKAKVVRERMADLDPASLPSAEQAKAMQRERHIDRAEPEPTAIKEPANQNIREPTPLEANENNRAEAWKWSMQDLAERIKAMSGDPKRQALEERGQAAFDAYMAHADAVLGQAKEFSAETIELDRWSAVYLSIPDRADAALLASARATVQDLVTAMDHYIEEGREELDRRGRGGPWDPFMTFGRLDVGLGATRSEYREQAVERLAELDDRLRPERVTDEKTRAAQTAARESPPEVGQQFRAAAVGVTEPAAPAFERATHVPHELAATADEAIERSTHAGERLLRGFGRLFSSFVDALADMIAPPPPPTRDQAERMARAADERQEARQQQEVQAERAAQHWLIAEAQRTAREREEATNEQERARRRREQDRGYERER